MQKDQYARHDYGKPGCKLKYIELEKPSPNQNEILIKIPADPLPYENVIFWDK